MNFVLKNNNKNKFVFTATSDWVINNNNNNYYYF